MKRLPQVVSFLMLAAAIALALSACTESETGMSIDTTNTGAAGTTQNQPPAQIDQQQDGGTPQVSAQRTVSLLRQGLQNVPVNQAMQNINSWQQQLQQRGGQSFQKINTTLDQLKSELQASQIDGPAVGELLTQLGQQTRQVASNTPGQQQQIQQLGQVLTQTGQQLTNSSENG